MLNELIDHLHDVSDKLKSNPTCRVFACRFMMLGVLTHKMYEHDVHTRRPTRPLCNVSVSSTLRTIQGFESPPLYLPSENSFGNVYNLPDGEAKEIWALQRDPFSSSTWPKKRRKKYYNEIDSPASYTPEHIMRHSCSLQSLLEPRIDSLEARVEGLELEHCPTC